MESKKTVNQPLTQSKSNSTPRAKSASGGSKKKTREKLKSKKQMEIEMEEGEKAQDLALEEEDQSSSSGDPFEQRTSLTVQPSPAQVVTLPSEMRNVKEPDQPHLTSPSETVISGSGPNTASLSPILQNISPTNFAANSEEAAPSESSQQINSFASNSEQIEIASTTQREAMDISQNPTIGLVDVSQLQSTDTIGKTVASLLASPPAFVRQAPQLLVPANSIVSIPQIGRAHV